MGMNEVIIKATVATAIRTLTIFWRFWEDMGGYFLSGGFLLGVYESPSALKVMVNGGFSPP